MVLEILLEMFLKNQIVFQHHFTFEIGSYFYNPAELHK